MTSAWGSEAEHPATKEPAPDAGSTGGGYERSADRSGIWAPDGGTVGQAGPETGLAVPATLTRPGGHR